MYDLATFEDNLNLMRRAATATQRMRFKHDHQNYLYREIIFNSTNSN